MDIWTPATISAISSAIYTILTLFILFSNRAQMKELKLQRKTSRMADIRIHFEEKNELYFFVITNIGESDAKNVQVRINQEFIQKINNENIRKNMEHINESSFFLAAKQTFLLLIGTKNDLKNVLTVPAIFNVTYDDITTSQSKNNEHNHYHCEIDLSQYKFIIDIGTPEEQIAEELKHLNREMDRIAKIINGMCATQNPKNDNSSDKSVPAPPSLEAPDDTIVIDNTLGIDTKLNTAS